LVTYDADVLIVGGGLAGLCAAISSSSNLSKTMIVTKTLVGAATTTSLAAGVVSAVTPYRDPEDSVERHYQDTMAGGCDINDRVLVKTMVNDIPKYFTRLLELGLEFEGGDIPAAKFIPGHSKPRSYFMKGKGVQLQALLRKVCEALGTKFLERTTVTSLVIEGERVVGAVGHRTDTKEAVTIRSKATILATGGAGELYSRTLMPIGSSGYGTALGLKAGAEVVDMEFVQFYPTMVYEEGLPRIFVDYSPLLRYGADAKNAEGESVFKKYKVEEPFKLTRDAFSVMLAKEMIGEGGERPLYLDCTAIKDADIKGNSSLASAVMDLESKQVPVRKRKFGISPYAHFFMGGLKTDANGATNVPGLYAAGEAVGGIHGANRIGGNAFAACIVFGFRSGMAASLYSSTVDPAGEEIFVEASSLLTEAINFNGTRDAREVKSEIQRIMWEKVGILRERKGLEEGLMALNSLRGAQLTSEDPVDKLLVPLMLDTADVITLSAMLREESRGAHYRLDYPEQREEWKKKTTLKLCEGKCELTLSTAEAGRFLL